MVAQDKKSFRMAASESDTTLKKEGVFILPLLYYTPDTRFAAGAMGVYYFRPGLQSSIDTRLSYVKFLADYTQNEQLDIWASWNIFTDLEQYLFKGELRYRNFPDRFYGIGNNTSKSNMERYSYDFVSAKLLGMKQVAKGLFVGADYQITHQYKFSYEPFPELLTPSITGYAGGTTSGLGLVSTYDSRDNVVNAYSGMFAEISSYFYRPLLGSSFGYNNINLIYTAYQSIAPAHVWGVHAVMNHNTEGVPFIEMAKVGNDDILRGYARNRFRDLNYVAVQTEYRFPLYRRLGGVAFAGVGDVFNSLSDLQWAYAKYTYGVGLRFAINTQERLNIRFDYGWGRGEQSFYLTLTEAF